MGRRSRRASPGSARLAVSRHRHPCPIEELTMKMKPLRDQVIDITGASSGIGLNTARMAAKQGARLVLAARNESALAQLTQEIKDHGGEAVYAVTDVADESQVPRLAERGGQMGGEH